MARPRTSGLDLPQGVYLKHGSYYFVQQNRWIRLCSERANVERELLHIRGRIPASMEAIATYTLRLVARTRANAKGRRGLPHSLTTDDALKLLWKAKWRCAVTNTPFSLVEVGPRRQKPYAPSIDRLDNDLGYSFENCRVVCMLANFAMNTWGAEALKHVAGHMRAAAVVLDSGQVLEDNAAN
jgi:hypothetical protein